MSVTIRKISKCIIIALSCFAVVLAAGLIRIALFEPQLIEMMLERIGG